ncbi:autotransporter-associated beta strand repeat-containing protein, partial [Bordetella avium]|uniref:autotransporter-associated beta strand repeat-containing protein n=1 Tax=Bordetella avium TaxID=521 RepID=UPI0039FCEF9C
MNHVYRLVWNRTMRLWQPVSELAAQSRGGAAPSAVYVAVRWRLHGIAVALGLGLAAWTQTAMAICASNPTQVTCDTPVNPLNPSYTNSQNGLTVTVGAGGTLGVLLGAGGTAMTLRGGNVAVTNQGVIDAFALGSGLSVVSSGLVLGQADGSVPGVSTYTIQNEASGLIGGSGRDIYEAQLANLTGMALSIHNGTGGVTNVTNNGIIRAAPVAYGSRSGADIAAVAIYGGGMVNFTNSSTGTIVGRVAFESAGSLIGHYFRNGGLIDGSVSLGAGSRNTFVAESGSAISATGQTGEMIGVTSVPGLLFARPGTVDGGFGGNNSLVFADTFSRGLLTSVAAGTYLNFNSLTVTGGSWTLLGGPLLPSGSSISLNGGTVLVDASGALGVGQISASGGAIGASAPGVSLGSSFNLVGSGLVVNSAHPLTLSGRLTGSGGLSVRGTQAVSLTGANDYKGDTTVFPLAELVGNASSLQGNIANHGTVTFSGAENGSFNGSLSGSGNLVKQGSGILEVRGLLGHTGSTAIQAGTLQLGPGGVLNSSTSMILSPGATLDLGESPNQSLGGLSGTGGTVTLGANTLSLFNQNDAVFGGVIQGSGGLIKNGLQTQTLTGRSTFSGGVNIVAGRLALGTGSSLAASSVITVGTQGTFDISAASNMELATLNGSGGNVALGANTLTLGSGNYGGVIAGTGGLTKNTAGSLVLNGENSYTGATRVAGGALVEIG